MPTTRDPQTEPPGGGEGRPAELAAWVAGASRIAGTSRTLHAALAADPGLAPRLRAEPAAALRSAGVDPDRAALAVARAVADRAGLGRG